MLDTYTSGSIDRISPEAPVSVLHVTKKEFRSGGAGNVALGLKALGADVAVIGRVGKDRAGKLVKNTLEGEKILTQHLLTYSSYLTPIKDRLIAGRQQILRVDEEKILPLPEPAESRVMSALEEMLCSATIVVISDYNKGFLTPSLLQKIIKKAQQRSIPVLCDPKGADFSKYSGSLLIKPNVKEALMASGLEEHEGLDRIAQQLLCTAEIPYLLITRSGEGMSLFEKNLPGRHFPVKSREVMDVTGAGDTVLATLASGIASGLGMPQAIDLANAAAGLAIERLGCAAITLSALARRLLEMDTENKIFDETHLYALKKALEHQEFSLLVIDTTVGITPELFRTIRKMTEKNRELLLYIRDPNPNEDLIHILSSLSEVSFVILKKESLDNLCQAIHPDEVHFLEKREEACFPPLFSSS